MFEIILAIALIFTGLFILVKGADYLVDGAADFARTFKVSPIIIGLTIVAFGTSLPEFVISLFSVISGKASISIGTIIGSNIANIGLAIGIAALISGLRIKQKSLLYEYPFMIISTALLLILANDHFIFQRNSFSLGRIDGLILMGIFIIFMVYIFKSIKGEKKSIKDEYKKELTNQNPVLKNILLIVLGIIGLVGGGKLFLIGAENLALMAGISDLFIGLSLAALGTSLPEIIVSIRAALKGHGDMAVGNVVGSCIFNILFVLAITSLIKPIEILPRVIAIDGMILALMTGMFLLFSTSVQRIRKWEGAILVLSYIAYFIFLVVRL